MIDEALLNSILCAGFTIEPIIPTEGKWAGICMGTRILRPDGRIAVQCGTEFNAQPPDSAIYLLVGKAFRALAAHVDEGNSA